MNARVRGAVGGFAAAIGVFAVLLWNIDIARFFQELRQADPIIIGLMGVGACGWLTAWSLSFRTVLGVLDGDLPVWRSVLAYASALCSNNITPFGQAGGEPVAAVFISRIASVEYETALASIASVDAINFAPSITFALLGVASYALFATLGQSLLIAGLVVIALALIVPVLLFLGWKYRYRFEQRAIAVLAPRLHSIGARLPRVSAPKPASIAHSIEHFFASIERITTDQRSVVIALAFSAVGWFVQMMLLWLAFIAIGHRIPLTVVFLVIPLGNVASIAPFPGGLGAIETVFIALLTSLTGVELAVATAAVLLYRGLIYGLPTIVGGSLMAVISTRVAAAS